MDNNTSQTYHDFYENLLDIDVSSDVDELLISLVQNEINEIKKIHNPDSGYYEPWFLPTVEGFSVDELIISKFNNYRKEIKILKVEIAEWNSYKDPLVSIERPMDDFTDFNNYAGYGRKLGLDIFKDRVANLNR